MMCTRLAFPRAQLRRWGPPPGRPSGAMHSAPHRMERVQVQVVQDCFPAPSRDDDASRLANAPRPAKQPCLHGEPGGTTSREAVDVEDEVASHRPGSLVHDSRPGARGISGRASHGKRESVMCRTTGHRAVVPDRTLPRKAQHVERPKAKTA